MEDRVEVLVGTGGSIPSKWSVWNEETDYVPMRSVTHLGSAYVCIKACTGVDPEADVALGDGVEGEYWIKTASKGDTGATPRLQMGKVETLEPEEAAKATITGTAEDPILNLQLPKGRQGDKGEKGDKGDKGDTGEKGEKGDTGATGPQGLQGPRGLKGDTGAQGAQGIPGDTGATGPKGDTGAKGDKGEKGDKGDTGEKGDKGDTGPQGAPGEPGKDGVTRWWKVDYPESSIAGEVLGLSYFGEDVTIDAFHVWDIVVANDGAIMPVEAIYTKDTLGYDAVALGLSLGKFNGDSVDAMEGEPLAEGANLNNTKFTSFAGNMKIFYTPSAVGDIQNTPEGLEASGVYFPMVICLKGAATHCIQYLIANNEIVSATNFNGATLYDKQVWMRNLDAFYWTPWTKVFPVSGGSGGGSVNSVNGVKPDASGNVNVLAWEEKKLVEIFPETSPTYSAEDSLFMMAGNLGLVDGKTYIVNWNGTEYTSTASDISAMIDAPAGSAFAMGNMGAMDPNFPNTGEPYLIQNVPVQGFWIAMPLDGATELTISITQDANIIKKLDNKFLDLAWLPTTYKGFERIWEATFTSGQAVNIPEDVATVLTTADEIKAECNGEAYNLKAYILTETQDGNAIERRYFGNLSISLSEMPDTGEPFLIEVFSANGAYWTSFFRTKSGITVETVAIDAAVLKYNTMPEEFLPGNAETTVPELSGSSHNSDAAVLALIEKEYAKKGVAICKYDGSIHSVLAIFDDIADGHTSMLLSHCEYVPQGDAPHFELGVLRYPTPSGDAIFRPVLNRTELYLDSSTDGSEKRFKITVDDSGTLTATEVTA